ncbi:MAG: autotransporter outer membrane beta-barrel domain-containing protein, partial [Selenomonadales bacterium]|nr:autotransporter outer membrane beta-barrel domain-containing protein [Selenomonadales bacterium]
NMYVHQDSMNSVVGRIGFCIGQKTTKANYFAKVALAHEFAGDFLTTYRADGEAGGRTNIDFGGTWCELQVGGSMKLSSTSVLYATYERSFGGDVEQKYRIDAGMRFSF